MKLRRIRWAGHVTRMAEMIISYKFAVERPEGKRPLGSIILKYMLGNKMWESALDVGYMVVIAASS
jgi:hypothetical protein